jgi:hypothetical protein
VQGAQDNFAARQEAGQQELMVKTPPDAGRRRALLVELSRPRLSPLHPLRATT